MSKVERTNAMRALEARGVAYEPIRFSPEIRSAAGVAEAAGLPAAAVFKTLVALRAGRGRPLLVMVPGDRELDLKRLARAAGEKKVRMASKKEAEALTGLETGGISALALLGRPFDVYLDRAAEAHPDVVVSAGARGLNLRLATADLVRVTGARVVEATAG